MAKIRYRRRDLPGICTSHLQSISIEPSTQALTSFVLNAPGVRRCACLPAGIPPYAAGSDQGPAGEAHEKDLTHHRQQGIDRQWRLTTQLNNRGFLCGLASPWRLSACASRRNSCRFYPSGAPSTPIRGAHPPAPGFSCKLVRSRLFSWVSPTRPRASDVQSRASSRTAF